MLDLDNYTMVLDGIHNPYIVCNFLTHSKLFIALYHSYTLVQYHFIYDLEQLEIVGDVVSVDLKRMSSQYAYSNYLYRSFYNDTHINEDGSKGEIYLFYRQGHSVIINANNMSDYLIDIITEYELGTMYFVYNRLIMVRSEQSLNFYKIEPDPITEVRQWTLYHSIKTTDFLSQTCGNKHF